MKTWLRAQPTSPPPSPSSKHCSTTSSTSTTTRRPHRSLPQRSTPAVAYAARPKATPGDRTATPTAASATTASTRPARVTLRLNGRLHHIGLGTNTPEPASSCSSPTSTSASSTPPPANSSATSPSTPTATTTPPADPPAHHPENDNSPNPDAGSGRPGCLETSHGADGSVLAQDIRNGCRETWRTRIHRWSGWRGLTLAGVQSPSGDHRCRRRGPPPG